MFEKAPREGISASAEPIPDRVRMFVWSLALADVMTVAWMLTAGQWLDDASPVTAVMTLGGHHLIVFWLAVVGFATLALMTVLTGALNKVRRVHAPFVVLGAVESIVAVAGTVSVVLLVVGMVAMVALLAATLSGGRVLLVGGLLRRR